MTSPKASLFTVLAALSLCACSSAADNSSRALPQGPFSQTQSLAHAIIASGSLYVAQGTTENVSAYALPLKAGETPYATQNDPLAFTRTGIAVNGSNLFTAEWQSLTIDVFSLPFRSNSSPVQTINANPDTVLAIGGNILYSVFNGNIMSALQAYDVTTDAQVAFVSTGPGVTGIAAGNGYLDVANAHAATLTAYALPLAKNKTPRVSVSTPFAHLEQMAMGDRELYVVNGSDPGEVAVYSVPLASGESPSVVLTLPDPCGSKTQAVGVGLAPSFMYVSDAGCNKVYVYVRPLTIGEQPKLRLTVSSPEGLAL